MSPEARLCHETWAIYEDACRRAQTTTNSALRRRLIEQQYWCLDNYFDAEDRMVAALERRQRRKDVDHT